MSLTATEIASYSPDYFMINGVSCTTVGLYCDTPSIPPMAEQRYTDYEVGADEDGCIPDDSFKDISYTIKAYCFGETTDFNNNDVYAFLSGAKTLQISRYSGYYFKVKKISAITPTTNHDGKRVDYQIKFTLAPFKYSTDNEAISLENGGIIMNNGSRYSKPLLTVTGTGTVVINCNGDTMTLNNLDGTAVTVDSTRLIAYKGTTLINSQVDGVYPMLASGQNLISWTGTATIALQKNERWY